MNRDRHTCQVVEKIEATFHCPALRDFVRYEGIELYGAAKRSFERSATLTPEAKRLLPSRASLSGEYLGPEKVIDVEGLRKMMLDSMPVIILGVAYRIVQVDIDTLPLAYAVTLKLEAFL